MQCAALEVIGRAERGRSGIRGARGWFERAAEVAERNGLTAWHLRARHELAILDWADGGERRCAPPAISPPATARWSPWR